MSIGPVNICKGTVVHRRYRPCPHELHYRVFSLLVDLDALEQADHDLRFFSLNRLNLFSLFERDHGNGAQTGLRAEICRQASRARPEEPVERIMMLCYPRLLGYAFNPLTVYYCLDGDGAVRTIVYQVNNTFGERHFYCLPAGKSQVETFAQSSPKQMYVSPFNDVSGSYQFHVTPPGPLMTVSVSLRVAGQPILKAYQTVEPEPLTDKALLRAFSRMPFMTFKVITAIHYEAFRLWLKGLRVAKRKAPPAAADIKKLRCHD